MMHAILENEYQNRMMSVERMLSGIHKEERLQVKGGELTVHCYYPPVMKALMVLLHGTSESAEKYHEMIGYFTANGIGVLAPDMRGHGKSLRQVDDPFLIHVDCFEDYADDAGVLVERFADSFEGPLYLFGHSLGGAVAADLMLRQPERFSRVILSSPMVDPSCGGIPRWIGVLIAEANCMTGRGKKMAFISSPYDPDKDTFEKSCDTGRVRFEYYKAKRRKETAYQTSALSYKWISESLTVRKKLLRHPNLGRVHSKVLLCQAGRDTVVCLPPQNAFVSKLPDARLVRFDEAKHEIYISENPTMDRYLSEIMSFLDIEDPVSF